MRRPTRLCAQHIHARKLNNSRDHKAHSALFIPDNNELVRQREYLLPSTDLPFARSIACTLFLSPSPLSPPPSLRTEFAPVSLLLFNPRSPCLPTVSLLLPPMSAIVSVYRVHIIVMTLRRYGVDYHAGGWWKITGIRSGVCVWTVVELDGFPTNYNYYVGQGIHVARVRDDSNGRGPCGKLRYQKIRKLSSGLRILALHYCCRYVRPLLITYSSLFPFPHDWRACRSKYFLIIVESNVYSCWPRNNDWPRS